MVSAAVVAALVLVGCSSGGDGDSERSGRADRAQGGSAEPPPTTAAPARIDLSKPIPGGSLYGTPRPPLENTGDDYVAIFESLVGNLRWISENPDPALLSELFVPGTPGHDERVPAYQYLIDNGYRFADEGYHLISVEVIDIRPEVVSLRAVQQVEFERVVDSAGAQVGEARRHGAPETLSFVLAPDSDGRWRIAGGDRISSAEVEL